MDQSDDKNLTSHHYDGIREYDNLLPNWWLMIFFGTIAFGLIYFLHYASGSAVTQEQELAADLSALPKVSEKVWIESELQGKGDMKIGQAIFISKCSACHGQEGQGVIGPNLSDKYWIHGKGLRKDIMQIVSTGVLEKGMPAWDGILSEDEEIAVTSYVYSLRNTQPVNPKAPQGEEIKD